jgi:hypothetical protein
MAKPRFDGHYIEVCLREIPIDNHTYEVNVNNKKIIIRGQTIKDHLWKLEHFEETKVAEALYWLRFYRRPFSDYFIHLAESLATNGSIVPGIHQVPLKFKD